MENYKNAGSYGGCDCLPDGISIPGLPFGQGGSDGSGWHRTETDGANTPGTIAGTDRGSGPHIHCVPRTPVFLLRKGIPGIPAAGMGGTSAAVRRRCDGTSAVAGCDRAGEESLSVLRAAAVCGGTAQREWYLTDREYREEEDELTWELEDEYGLIPEIRLLPEAADYDRVRLEATAPCLVLDFSDSDKVYGGGLAAGSVWLDFPASEEKERRVTSGCPQIRYFSMKKEWKDPRKALEYLDTISKNGYNNSVD